MTVLERPRTLNQVVHEMRNIFCIIVNNLELLRDVSAPGTQKMIKRAIDGADRGTAILSELTALNREI